MLLAVIWMVSGRSSQGRSVFHDPHCSDRNLGGTDMSVLLILLLVLLLAAAIGGGILVSKLLWLLLIVALVVLVVGLVTGRSAAV